MSGDTVHRRRSRSRWRGPLISLAVLVALAVAAVLAVGWIAERATPSLTPPWGPECAAWVGGEDFPLDRDQARRATTAAAVLAQGEAAPITAPDTADIPEPVMTALVEGPEGDAGPSLTCRSGKNPDLAVQEGLEPSGLTARAEHLRQGMQGVFGGLSLGGYTPGGYNTGHGERSAHYEGRAIDIFYRPVDEGNRRSGWVLAHWLIAHAPDYEIDVIIFDDRIWSTYRPSMGWRDYDAPDPDNEILRHLDHVHVDVQRGTGSGSQG
ncbi:hypothetical protein [Nocardiopsis sp. CNT312]|uniref:hypothetical protein n=1 Tax=Nocardiopsis sp. CNT312 TaxID=1137268 RepID=UPI0004B9BE94|nr:hypothetical protein [Nocardiopsis sp. CNT312]